MGAYLSNMSEARCFSNSLTSMCRSCMVRDYAALASHPLEGSLECEETLESPWGSPSDRQGYRLAKEPPTHGTVAGSVKDGLSMPRRPRSVRASGHDSHFPSGPGSDSVVSRRSTAQAILHLADDLRAMLNDDQFYHVKRGAQLAESRATVEEAIDHYFKYLSFSTSGQSGSMRALTHRNHAFLTSYIPSEEGSRQPIDIDEGPAGVGDPPSIAPRPCTDSLYCCKTVDGRIQEYQLREFLAVHQRECPRPRLVPLDAIVLDHLGQLFFEKGRAIAAYSCYRAALRHAPDQPLTLYHLGILHYALGALDTAQAYFEDAVRKATARAGSTDFHENPAGSGALHIPLLFSLGTLSRDAGDSAKAREYFHTILALEPDNTAALVLLGDCFEKEGDAKSALNCLQRAQRLDPTDYSVRRSVARLVRRATPSTPNVSAPSGRGCCKTVQPTPTVALQMHSS